MVKNLDSVGFLKSILLKIIHNLQNGRPSESWNPVSSQLIPSKVLLLNKFFNNLIFWIDPRSQPSLGQPKLLIQLFCLFFSNSALCSTRNKIIKTPKQSVSIWGQLFDNFHAVEKGKLYRSQQLSPHKLTHYLKRHGIKTVINLRGAKHNELWWHLEKTASKLHKAEHHDVPMSAMTFPSQKSLKKLINIYQTARQPILIHCLGGADRTGEAAAVWALAIQKKNVSDALTHLSPWYHHLPWMAPKKQQFIKMWRGIDWALKSYFPPDGNKTLVIAKKE